MKPTLLLCLCLAAGARAQTVEFPKPLSRQPPKAAAKPAIPKAATTNQSPAAPPKLATVTVGGVFDTPQIIAYRQQHGDKAVIPMELLEAGLAGAVGRRETIYHLIATETADERKARSAAVNSRLEYGNSTDLLKRMAGLQAQAMGTPRHSLGDLRAYVPPTIEDYCRGDARWRAADQEIRQWQALIRSRLQADERAAKAAKANETPETASRIVAFLQQQADQGSARARYELGLRLLDGQGVPADAAKGLALISLAASEGHEPAQAYLRTTTPAAEPAGAP